MRVFTIFLLLFLCSGCRHVTRVYYTEPEMPQSVRAKMCPDQMPPPVQKPTVIKEELQALVAEEDDDEVDLFHFEEEEKSPLVMNDAKNIVAREISRLITIYSIKLQRDFELHLDESVACFQRDPELCIQTIRLNFHTQGLKEMCDARKMLVDVVEPLLEEINQNEIIKTTLCNTPFSANNLEIFINFESFFGRYVDPPGYIGKIALQSGVARYYAFEVKECRECWKMRSEHYFQSRNLVAYQREGEKLYPKKSDDRGITKFFGLDSPFNK